MMLQSYFIFVFMNAASVVIGLSESSMILQWGTMEFSMLMVVPILSTGPTPFKILASVNYFLSQTPVSVWILFSIMFLNSSSLATIVVPCLLFKLGLPPFTGWLFNLVKMLEFKEMLIILTLQKFLPLNMLESCAAGQSSHIFISMVCGVVSLFIYTNSLNALKPVILVSSIASGYWPLSMLVLGASKWLEFFFLYCWLLAWLFAALHTVKIKNYKDLARTPHPSRVVIMYHLLTVGGMPPTMGFLIKAAAFRLMSHSMSLLPILLLFGSFLVMYYFMQYILPLINLQPYCYIQKMNLSWNYKPLFISVFNPFTLLLVFIMWG